MTKDTPYGINTASHALLLSTSKQHSRILSRCVSCTAVRTSGIHRARSNTEACVYRPMADFCSARHIGCLCLCRPTYRLKEACLWVEYGVSAWAGRDKDRDASLGPFSNQVAIFFG